MKRNKRQLKLVEIINNHDVETQGELIELLQAAGFSVTQATISRDINDLGITKVIAPNRRYKYICPLEEKEDLKITPQQALRVMKVMEAAFESAESGASVQTNI